MTFTPANTMVAIIKSLMSLRPPVPRPNAWRYPLMSSRSPPGRRHLAPDLFENRIIRLEIRREEVRGRVRRPGWFRQKTVALEEAQVMPDRSVVETEVDSKLIRVARTF